MQLTSLVKAWAQFRVKPTPEALNSFEAVRTQMFIEVATFSLFALQQVLSSLASANKEYLSSQKNATELITENDWLMNQLIRGSQENSDPFLQEAPDASPPACIEEPIAEHDARVVAKDKPHVVIIDDQLSLGTFMINTLKDFAFNASHYLSIEDFKAQHTNLPVDLVLLDIVMPNISQEAVFDFAAELVKNDIKVISCSSTFTFETRLLAVRANVSDYVVKPINTYVLVEKIGRALSLKSRRKHRLVILDDQATMGEFYKAMLEQTGCDVTFFASPADMFASLDDLSPDMFLLDMCMPNVDGLEVAKMIRQEHKFDFAPILFITANETIEKRLAAIDAGADDVIAKSCSVTTITSQIMTRLNRASKVRSFVATDPLTGVLNHGQIVEVANQTIRLSKRRSMRAAIAVIDVDKFKLVNDTHGHLVGDKVLTALGQLLSNSCRDTDSVGRYGGEEFVIIFQDCSVADAAKKVNMIRRIFGNMKFNGNSTAFAVTFSAGIANLNAFETVQPAISVADKALYKAKLDGRNKVIAIRDK
ncbi:MAG: diguanylate cyclase [Glaciecola sp.]